MNLKKTLAALFVLAVIGLFCWYAWLDRSARHYTYFNFGAPIPGSFQYLGIDVSHHQGKINWKDVAAMKVDGDSISFAYIKATEGTSFTDRRWKENAEAAYEVDIPFGLYHFFRPDKPAGKQAIFFAEKCLGVPDTLRPMIDVEISAGYNKERLVDSVVVFMSVFRERMKMAPVIYTYESFFNDFFIHPQLKSEYFWIANYNGSCDALENEQVIAWQFSEKGTVNGISGRVDLNVAGKRFKEVMFQD